MKQKYTIIHVSTYLEGGGAETHVRLFSEYMSRRGHKVIIYYLKGSNNTQKELESKGIKVVKGSPNMKGLIKLLQIIRKEKPQFVHAHLYTAEVLATIAKAISKQKFNLIIMRHVDFWPYKPRKILQFLQKYIIYPTADKVVGISYAVRNFIREEMRYNFPNVEVIHYGIPLNPPKSRAKYKPADNLSVIGFAGRLTYQKGLDVLFKALNILEGKEKFHMLIAGTGFQENILKNIIKKYKTIKIHLLGFVKDIHNFYESIDALVFPSRFEGFGLVALEAMIHNKPVIATKVSSLPEVIGDAGILIEKENYKELANAIKAILTLSPKQKNELSKKISQQIKKFDINIMLNKYEELYENLLRRSQII